MSSDYGTNSDVVEVFLRSSKNVCPWGRHAAVLGRVQFAIIRGEDSVEQRWSTLRCGVGALSRSEVDVVIVRDPCMPEDHKDAMRRTANFCAELSSAFAPAPPTPDQLLRFSHQVVEQAAERPEFLIELLQSLPHTLFVIIMNPLYPDNHPRYAPVPIYVVTRVEDVHRAQLNQKAAVRALRAEVVVRAGGVYNVSLPCVPSNAVSRSATEALAVL